MPSERRESRTGDVSPSEAFESLRQQSNAQLVDVRSRAEWSFVGVPDLSPIGKNAILIEWQRWPDMAACADFLPQLEAALKERGLDRDAPLYFLCRSGVRSGAAAMAAAAAGFSETHNILGGFEGPTDESRHRGHVAGWKAENLPWFQS